MCDKFSVLGNVPKISVIGKTTTRKVRFNNLMPSLRATIRVNVRRRRKPIPWPLRSLRIRPQLSKDRKLLAPPLCEEHQLIGTAFEHLLRLELQRLNPTAELGRSVVSEAVDLAELTARGGGRVSVGIELVPSPSGKGFATAYSESATPDDDVKILRLALQKAEEYGRDYVNNGVLVDDILVSCWMTAKIIGSFQVSQRNPGESVYIPFKFPGVDISGLKDVRAMFALVDPEIFRAKQRCLLNPTFRFKHPVGTNQPDFVIDDMIVDVKCTARKSLDRRDIDQLLRYYALSKIYGFDERNDVGEINRLAIYFARFAQMFVIDVRRDFPPERVIKFLGWFEQKVSGKGRRTEK